MDLHVQKSALGGTTEPLSPVGDFFFIIIKIKEENYHCLLLLTFIRIVKQLKRLSKSIQPFQLEAFLARCIENS